MQARVPAIAWFALFVGIAILGWIVWQNRPIQYGPDVVRLAQGSIDVSLEPEQGESSGDWWSRGTYNINSLATFHIRARVLSAKRYYFGSEADISPIDVALGWGPMADPNVLRDVEISQSGRWYHWYCSTLPIPESEIISHSANMHLIPANTRVADGFRALRKGVHVEIEGDLVSAATADGWRWTSSLSRHDSGDGACEIIYVKKLSFCEP